jgi:arylsulfatase A-like enzyme
MRLANFVIAAVLLWCGAGKIRAETNRAPNIIFLLADDLGYGDVGCFGQKKIRTPNLDQMAAEGMRFTQHYSGNAVCAPSRCVLMTGLHPGHAFIRDNREVQPEGQVPIPANTVTLAKLLQRAGYVTGAFGKWGLGGPGSSGDPLKQGFDRFYGYNCQRRAHNYYPTTLLELAGAGELIPKGIDGISFAPTLLGRRQDPRAFLYREFPGYGGQQSVRLAQWKGLREKMLPGRNSPQLQLRTMLYDLNADPQESNDVAALHPDVVSQIERIMREQHVPSKEFPFAPLDSVASGKR